ncbi:MAG: ribbon-helix-helix protein, CopG family [Proteobacteria bacterium]|nr:ribbon-helix-helix protein, CopG family [Pseudomonadota bacterium]
MSQTVSVRLEEKILRQLDMMAKISDRSRAWLMSKAVEQYVEHEAWQIEEIQHSLAKLENGTGKFASQENVKQWLASWGSEGELEPPQCK